MLLLTHDKSFDPKNYYEILGVSKDATKRELHKAFRRLSKLHHPDKGGDKKKFQQILDAYEALSNDEQRFMYDTLGFEKRKLKNAVNILVDLMVGAFQQGHKHESKVKNFVRQSVVANKKNIQGDIDNLSVISGLMQEVLTEVEDSNYIMQLARENTQQKLTTIARDIEQLREALTVFEAVETLLVHLNMKTKNYEQWTFYQPAMRFTTVNMTSTSTRGSFG